MESKLPRAVLALLVGLAFGVGGAIFQTTLRNPLASPDIIGVSTGASASAVVAIVLLDLQGAAVSAGRRPRCRAGRAALARAVGRRRTPGSGWCWSVSGWPRPCSR